ncbi:MAG: TIM barrel protein [Bacteroidetes bacterium]|nr:TIM barrel protein [Bacteroidota bacterium]
MKSNQTRKEFIRNLSIIAGATAIPGSLFASCGNAPGSNMKLGLVTYNWGKDWDIPTIIKNCSETNILGVELRVDHAHGVNYDMSAAQRAEVKKQFDDSPIEIVGMGTNEEYHSADPAKVKAAIENTKKWLHLSKDTGGSGVKVKPNGFPEGVAKEKTLEQIGKSLNDLGKYALDMGQQLRLEVHGRETQQVPNIKKIMEYVENKGATVCWNCNDQDLDGQGLEYNFNSVKDRFGDTCHIRELNVGDYPYQQLMDLFVKIDYPGWILLECRTKPEDLVAALHEQYKVWQTMVASAQAKL